MASRRDSKQTGRDNRARPAGRKGGGMMFGLFLGLVGGLVLAAGMAWFFYSKPSGFKVLDQVPEIQVPTKPGQVDASLESKETAKPKSAQESKAQDKPAAPPENPYSFYDILPGKATPKPTEPPQAKQFWWLQVAALKSAEDADRLKAKLTLLNLDTQVSETQVGSQTLYRVRVGPYKTEDAALGAQDALAVNNFEPRLIKEAVNP